MGPYLNRQDLAESLVSAVRRLRQAQAQTDEPAHSVQSAPLSTRRWRMVDRLGEADQEQLVVAFTAGTSKRKLAERYGISESSVKRLIRQHGVSKESSGLSQGVYRICGTALARDDGSHRRREWILDEKGGEYAMTLIVEGTSEVAYFIAVDRKITELSVRRDAYSRAHELAHQALVDFETGVNNTGMAVFDDVLRLLAHDAGETSPEWLEHLSMAGAVSTATFLRPTVHSALRLPTWRTRTFAGLAQPTWSSSDAPETGVASTPLVLRDSQLTDRESPAVTLRLSAHYQQLLVDIRVALIRLMGVLRRMVRVCKRLIRTTCRMRLVVRNALAHRPNVLALVLVILATCRRYGRRSEPDDHASLRNRRHLVIMGSCLHT